MLIIVCGLPGTGKTFLSKELAVRLGAEHLSTDSIRMRLLDRRTYSEEEKKAVYRAMADEAGRLVAAGRDVVADATFYRREYRDMMKAVAEKGGTGFYAVLCVLDEGKVAGRIDARRAAGSESEADFKVYMALKGKFEPFSGEHLEVDMSLPISQAVKAVMQYVGR